MIKSHVKYVGLYDIALILVSAQGLAMSFIPRFERHHAATAAIHVLARILPLQLHISTSLQNLSVAPTEAGISRCRTRRCFANIYPSLLYLYLYLRY